MQKQGEEEGKVSEWEEKNAIRCECDGLVFLSLSHSKYLLGMKWMRKWLAKWLVGIAKCRMEWKRSKEERERKRKINRQEVSSYEEDDDEVRVVKGEKRAKILGIFAILSILIHILYTFTFCYVLVTSPVQPFSSSRQSLFLLSFILLFLLLRVLFRLDR